MDSEITEEIQKPSLDGKSTNEDSLNCETDSESCNFKFNFKTNDPDSVEGEIANLNIDSSNVIESVKDSFNPVNPGASEVIEKFEFVASSPSESIEAQIPDEKLKVNLNIKEVPEKVEDKLPEESVLKEESNNDLIEKVPVEQVSDRVEVRAKINLEGESKDMDEEKSVEVSKSDISSESQINIPGHSDVEEVSEEVHHEVLENQKEDISSGDQTTDSINQEIPEEVGPVIATEASNIDVSPENETNDSIHKEIPEELSQVVEETTAEIVESSVSSEALTTAGVHDDASGDVVQNKSSGSFTS